MDILSKEQWFAHPQLPSNEVSNAVKNKTYVGIDFGTSTTVVSIIAIGSDGIWHPETLQIKQPDGNNGFDEYNLVNSILVWKNNKLLFGHPAFALKQFMKYGRNMFSSFKMDLGLDLGPTYPNSLLAKRFGHKYVIENALDAAKVFFQFLVSAIKDSIHEKGLPEDIEYIVSVPASFHDSQRRDLLKALQFAGIVIEDACFIDEPNAAFLSYFYECWKENGGKQFLTALRDNSANILVYDFGAGTCDLSILHVRLQNGRLCSRNLAISRFTALGGDNIDFAIAKYVLFDKIKWDIKDPDFYLSDIRKNDTIIPRIMPIAEQLKTKITEYLSLKEIDSIYDIDKIDYTISEEKIFEVIRSDRVNATICPSLNTKEYKDVMLKFLGDDVDSDDEIMSVYEPIEDVLDKAGIEPEDLYGVLFIGGSSENPFVRNTIMGMLPRNVKRLIPSDLRCHVSQGAAIHCIGYYAFDLDFIQPVTSDDINVVVAGGGLSRIVASSTPVPSPVIRHEFCIIFENQTTVEIPICLTTKDHLLGIITFSCGEKMPFKKGEIITLECTLTRSKILDVSVYARGEKVASKILSPILFEPVSPKEKKYLEAKKRYREECLASGGDKYVSTKTIVALIKEAEALEYYKEVLDLYMILDNREKNYESFIVRFADLYGDEAIRKKWLKIQYKRHPIARNALLCADESYGAERVDWLRKALSKDPENYFLMYILGSEIGNEQEGKYLITKVYNALLPLLDRDFIQQNFLSLLENCSIRLDKKDTLKRIQLWRENQKRRCCTNYRQYTKNDEDNILIDYEEKKDFEKNKIYNDTNLVSDFTGKSLK